MGAIKANNYSRREMDISLIARGVAHPARVRMIRQLREGGYRNIDFCRDLRMKRSSIKEHIDKLIDADLIRVDYLPHFYMLTLNPERVKYIDELMGSDE